VKAIWAPWRLQYIVEKDGKQECFICEAARADKTRFDAHLVLARQERALAILNRYPYNNGHVMVAPVRHEGEPEGLTGEEVVEIWELVCRVKQALGALSHPDGFNVGINLGKCAGAGLPGHLHVHVVPRWAGDTNFMPVLGETKVMPESLESMYRKLSAGLSR